MTYLFCTVRLRFEKVAPITLDLSNKVALISLDLAVFENEL